MEATYLYEKLKESNKQQELLINQLEVRDVSQKEFINAAAHELRTPIQPILSLSDILLSKTVNTDQSKELLEIIRRNAKRLYRLSEDILDVAKIESNSLVLQKERINLNELIHGVITEYKSQIKEINYVNLNLAFSNYDIFVEADKSRHLRAEILFVNQNLIHPKSLISSFDKRMMKSRG